MESKNTDVHTCLLRSNDKLAVLAVYLTLDFLSKRTGDVWQWGVAEIRAIGGCSHWAGHPGGVFTSVCNNTGLAAIGFADSVSWAFTAAPLWTPWTRLFSRLSPTHQQHLPCSSHTFHLQFYQGYLFVKFFLWFTHVSYVNAKQTLLLGIIEGMVTACDHVTV